MWAKYLNIIKLVFSIKRVEKKVDDLLLLTAQQTIKSNNRLPNITSLAEVEFRVYSQWGDDGIIQYMINKIPVANRVFIEFGVENYRESNTRFLLMNNNWRGLVFDGAAKHIKTIQEDEIYWRYDLTARHEFITKENINALLEREGFTGNIGILHIDIDGNDYWVWDAITVADPDIFIVEYNSLLGYERSIVVPYQSDFSIDSAHYSRVYYGASIAAFHALAKKKGYFFVGCNSAGINAYFVKNTFKDLIAEVSIEKGYVRSASRQTRDDKGNLSFLSFDKAAGLLKGLPVYNTESEKMEKI